MFPRMMDQGCHGLRMVGLAVSGTAAAGVSGLLTGISGTAEGVSGLLIGVSGLLEDGPSPLSCGLASAELESSRFTGVTPALKTLFNNTK